jgi:probable rRNA maturation factor
VTIILTDNRFALDKKNMTALVKKILLREKASQWSLDIIYCRDSEIIPLNLRFKGKSRSTDVLAFNLDDPGQKIHLGEIYVNLQMARRQARDNRVTYLEEVKRLTIHGVLHLLGYRDDTPENRARMWARQESYL